MLGHLRFGAGFVGSRIPLSVPPPLVMRRSSGAIICVFVCPNFYPAHAVAAMQDRHIGFRFKPLCVPLHRRMVFLVVCFAFSDCSSFLDRAVEEHAFVGTASTDSHRLHSILYLL